MKIFLKSKNKPLLFDSISIVEKVAGLTLLPEGTNYKNIGGTCNHHGPSDILSSTSPCQTPDNNHWCIPSFADSLQLVINKFYNWSSSEEGGGIPIIVYLNDMSLPFGGRFDINGRWDGRTSQTHLYHRIGTSVDISRRDGITEDQIDNLSKFMEGRGLIRDGERPEIHYGFKEGN
jgi:hypothetical protein